MLRLWSLFVRFFRIGAFTIGGGIVMLGVIESEMRAMGELSDEEIADMIVLATAVPGPIATNHSFVAGKALAGWPGALVAVVGTSLAPFLSILFLSSIILRHLGNPWLGSFFLGASAGVVVVVGNTLWKMIRTAVTRLHHVAAFATSDTESHIEAACTRSILKSSCGDGGNWLGRTLTRTLSCADLPSTVASACSSAGRPWPLRSSR